MKLRRIFPSVLQSGVLFCYQLRFRKAFPLVKANQHPFCREALRPPPKPQMACETGLCLLKCSDHIIIINYFFVALKDRWLGQVCTSVQSPLTMFPVWYSHYYLFSPHCKALPTSTQLQSQIKTPVIRKSPRNSMTNRPGDDNRKLSRLSYCIWTAKRRFW